MVVSIPQATGFPQVAPLLQTTQTMEDMSGLLCLCSTAFLISPMGERAACSWLVRVDSGLVSLLLQNLNNHSRALLCFGKYFILPGSAQSSPSLERLGNPSSRRDHAFLLCFNKLLTSRCVCSLAPSSRLPSPLSIFHVSRHISLHVCLPHLPNLPKTYSPHSAPLQVNYIGLYYLDSRF